MSDEPTESSLVEKARGGDARALERLLMLHHDRLVRSIHRHLPAESRGVLAADDVVQETLIEAFRRIDGFTPRGEGSFYRWLATIARHRMLDLLEKHRAAKRGKGAAASTLRMDSDGVLSLLELVAVHEKTPSRSAARREAVAAVHAALEMLKPEYREAIRLRYFEHRPVAEAAARMGRTEGAVHMLCRRALEQLRVILGSRSRYLGRKE